MLVKISDIKVKKRIRQDLGDIEELKGSLKNYGLLNPITLNSDMELVAGQRRLEAAKGIGWETINAVILDKGVDKIKQLELELEENNQRKDFSDDELMAGYERLRQLRNPTPFARAMNFFMDLFERLIRWIKSLFGKKEKQVKLPPAQQPAVQQPTLEQAPTL